MKTKYTYCATCERYVNARFTDLIETHGEDIGSNSTAIMLVCDSCGGCVQFSECTGEAIGHIANSELRDRMKDINHLRDRMLDEMPRPWFDSVLHRLRQQSGLLVFKGNHVSSEEHADRILEIMNRNYSKFLSIQHKL